MLQEGFGLVSHPLAPNPLAGWDTPARCHCQWSGCWEPGWLCPKALFSRTRDARALYEGAASPHASRKPPEMFLGLYLALIWPPAGFFADCCSLEAIRESSAQEKRFLPLVSCSTDIISPKLGDEMKKDLSSPFCSTPRDPGPQGRWLTPSPLCPPPQAAPG